MQGATEPTSTSHMDHSAVIVKAWAPWCSSCRTLSPIVDAVAADLVGVAVIGVRVDSEPELVERFGVRSVPTLIALRDGIEVERLSGLQSVGTIRTLFEVATGEADRIKFGRPVMLVGARAGARAALASSGVLLGSVALIAIGAILLVWAISGLVRR